MNATISLIALNFLVYFAVYCGICSSNVILGLNMSFTDGLYVWQPATSMFMHANLTHLLMNMAVLYQFGSLLERRYGSEKFAVIYCIGGVLTSLLSFIYIYVIFKIDGTFINLVGASGAISLLLGILAFLDASSRKGLIIAILLMSFVPVAMGVNVAWYAHIIGFALGYFGAKFKVIK